MPAMSADANRLRYTDPPNPHELIDTPWGRMESWRAATMATGEMGAYSQYMTEARAQFAQIRDDSVSILADAQAKIETLQKLQDGTLEILHRLDAFISRAEARACKDAEEREERKRFNEPIPSPPGTEPDDAPIPGPAGDLHSLAPKAGLEEVLASETEADAGGVALSYPPLPLSYVRDQEDPEPLDPDDPEFDPTLHGPVPRPRGATQRDPVGISMHSSPRVRHEDD
jgi:hypothetical protein